MTLTEWTDAGARQVTVALDPALSPQQNMERHYRHYRRIVESATRVEARAAEMRAREVALRALLDAVDAAPLESLARLEREARALSAGPKAQPAAGARRRREEPPPPYRTFHSLAGVQILVGRGAAQNDALTLRTARGNDAWLHARGITGAHVVIRVARGRHPTRRRSSTGPTSPPTSATRAASPPVTSRGLAPGSSGSPEGSAPGAVTYSQERVIALRIEPLRIERLLAAEEAAP